MDPDAYASVMAHPYVVTLINAEWIVQNMVGFQREAEAVAFARSRPEPVIYVDDRRDFLVHVVGARITVPHPTLPDDLCMIMRDDFPPIDPRTEWPIDFEEGEA